nr:unnamed protein product [Callosobruchus analis]
MYKWTHQNTLLLLDLYKKYKTMVTEGRIRLKKLYECIANEIKVKTRENVTAANCENCWKVLERNFKKYCDNNKKTGRGKIFFEYADIMEDMLQTKRNVHPVLLLSTEIVQELDISGKESVDAVELEESTPQTPKTSLHRQHSQICPVKKTKTYQSRKLKCTVLQEIKNDRREFYRQMLDIERNKLKVRAESNR